MLMPCGVMNNRLGTIYTWLNSALSLVLPSLHITSPDGSGTGNPPQRNSGNRPIPNIHSYTHTHIVKSGRASCNHTKSTNTAIGMDEPPRGTFIHPREFPESQMRSQNADHHPRLALTFQLSCPPLPNVETRPWLAGITATAESEEPETFFEYRFSLCIRDSGPL